MRQGRLFCFHVRCSLQLLNMKISVALFISMQLNFFQLKIKKNEQNAYEDDLFPYVLHNLTNFTKLAEIFFLFIQLFNYSFVPV